MLSLAVFIGGLGVGSFLAVVISRGRKLFSKKRSFCDSCERVLVWWENVPLFSFFFLKGKCRTCRSPIPFWFFATELITGLTFLFTYLTWQASFFSFSFSSLIILLLWLIITSFLILVLVIDFQKMIIPDWSVLGLVIFSLIFQFFTFSSSGDLVNKLLAGLAASGFLLFLHLITRGKGMGLGDVKLAIFMGLFLGLSKVILALYLAILTGAFLGVIMIGLKKAKFKQQIPFGPFLVLGTFVAWWWGDNILFWTNQWLGF